MLADSQRRFDQIIRAGPSSHREVQCFFFAEVTEEARSDFAGTGMEGTDASSRKSPSPSGMKYSRHANPAAGGGRNARC